MAPVLDAPLGIDLAHGGHDKLNKKEGVCVRKGVFRSDLFWFV